MRKMAYFFTDMIYLIFHKSVPLILYLITPFIQSFVEIAYRDFMHQLKCIYFLRVPCSHPGINYDWLRRPIKSGWQLRRSPKPNREFGAFIIVEPETKLGRIFGNGKGFSGSRFLSSISFFQFLNCGLDSKTW